MVVQRSFFLALSSFLPLFIFLESALAQPIFPIGPVEDDAFLLGTEGNNLNLPDSLCLETRSGQIVAGATLCSSDADCGEHFRCSYFTTDPFFGGVCVESACHGPGEAVVVDVELGPTSDIACGSQLFLEWDTSGLNFVSLELDPDGEFNWTQVFVSEVDEELGQVDVAFATAIGVACDAENGRDVGGTIARLTFTAVESCGDFYGVRFRDHDPVSGVGGPSGMIPLTDCNGRISDNPESVPVKVQLAPQWSCPGDQAGHVSCQDLPSLARTVSYDPVSLFNGGCDETSPEASELCEVTVHSPCQGDLDCGYDPSNLCANDAECGGGEGDCVAFSEVDGFICAGGLPCVGVCRMDSCIDGYCGTGSPAENSTEILQGDNVSVLPGRYSVSCEYTNSCGLSDECSFSIENSGMVEAALEVQLSPTMASGYFNNPISRCVEFEVGRCGVEGEPLRIAKEMNFGHFPAPGYFSGVGGTTLLLPANYYTCVSAADPKHSLRASTMLSCGEDGRYGASFSGSPNLVGMGHWLIQGNLDGHGADGVGFIDIFDWVILLGRMYTLTASGNDSPCDPGFPDNGGFNGDFNGDGLVTPLDTSFVIFNMLSQSEELCSGLCSSLTAVPPVESVGKGSTTSAGVGVDGNSFRLSVSEEDWNAAGLAPELLAAADVNQDGVVDPNDITLTFSSFASAGMLPEAANEQAKLQETEAAAYELKRRYEADLSAKLSKKLKK